MQVQSALTEGLDEFFDATPEPGACATEVPIDEAASILGVSTATLRRRLRNGSLQGSKVQTSHGQKWFVKGSELGVCVVSTWKPVISL
jgi:hypothetical protein